MKYKSNAWMLSCGVVAWFLARPELAWGQPFAPPGIGPDLDGAQLLGILVGLLYGTILLAAGQAIYRRQSGHDLPGGYLAVGLLVVIVGGGAFGLWLAGQPRILGVLTGILGGLFLAAFLIRPTNRDRTPLIVALAVIGGALLGWWLSG